MGKKVILGRKTLDSLPGGLPLQGRESILLSRNCDLIIPDCFIVHSVEDALTLADNDTVVIGGGEIYRRLLPFCNEVLVTRLINSYDTDTFLLNLDTHPDWELVERDGPIVDGDCVFHFDKYVRSSKI